MPEQDANAPEMNEAEEVLGMALVAGDESPVVLKPGEEPFYPPATPHPTKWAAILSLRAPAVAAVPSDQLDSAVLSQAFVQSVAVVGPVADQALGSGREEPVVDRLLYEGELMGRCACDSDGDRETRTVCNGHDLGALPPLCLPDARAPFFAPAKVASMKHSVRSMAPRS